MNATAAPVSVPVVLTVLHLSLAEMPASSSNPGYVPADEAIESPAASDVGAQERHVQSWRASLGHAYAEWAQGVPGER
ncbi:MAG: hypothetical protein JNL92_18395 [Opitutaceae bacterium]|nr:hypothetical protein [Opitutaceae bacterium]